MWNIGKFSRVGKLLDNSKIIGNFPEWENWGKDDETLKQI